MTEAEKILDRRKKLYKEDKEEIMRRFKSGERQSDIARSYCVTRQCIQRILRNNGYKCHENKTVRETPYKNLREWLRREDTPSYTAFMFEIFGGANPNAIKRMKSILSGKDKVNLTIGNIRKMEQVTGMTFDEIFYKEE